MTTELTELKKLEQYIWLNDVNSQSLQQVLKQVNIAFKTFLKNKKDPNHKFNKPKKGKNKDKKDMPRFKSKHNKQSFKVIITNDNLKVDFDANRIKIPKFKTGIKTVFHRLFTGTIKQATITKTVTICNIIKS